MAQACRHPAAGVGTRGENAGLPAGFLPGWWSLVKIASVLTLLPAESTCRVLSLNPRTASLRACCRPPLCAAAGRALYPWVRQGWEPDGPRDASDAWQRTCRSSERSGVGEREGFSEAEMAAAAVYRSDCGRAARGVLGCPRDRGVLCDRLLPAGDLPRPLGRPESGWGTGCAQRSGSGDTDLRGCVPVPLAAGTEEDSERAWR